MSFLLFLSDAIIPIFIVVIIGYGLLTNCPIYDTFIHGAMRGLKTVVHILPTLIGLLLAVGILRTSGFLLWFAGLLAPVCELLSFPSELLSVAFVKLFSSSAATGLALDIFKQFGTDSFEGLSTSIMLSCTESVFYTMSIYFMSINIKKTRWTLPCALLSTLAGIIMSVILARMMLSI
ncbi:MAG: spore maturation protein [Eubacterium sp.]|nr:spore maturation protein [Eubacterium sp.]